MKLHTCFITYNRLELTKRAIESYLETVSVPFTAIVEDNGSDEATTAWLLENYDRAWPRENAGWGLHLLGENKYPGWATNNGWSVAPEDATHLHRADNDFAFLPGWCEEVEREFADPSVGQVGLRTGTEEEDNWVSVGGNCVIRRELWDQGLRFDERPWPEFEPGWTEDNYFSIAVEGMGYLWKRVKRPCIVPLDQESPDDDYYIKSWSARGILEWALERHGR